MSLTSKLNGAFPDKEFQDILRNVIPKKDEFCTVSGNKAFSNSYVMKIPNELVNIYEAGTVGTAFDYLARFIVAQKINKNKEKAYTKTIAEIGLSWVLLEIMEEALFEKFDKKYKKSIKIIEEYVNGNNTEVSEDLIDSACYLARLDSVVRARVWLRNLEAFPFKKISKDIINELKRLTSLFIDTFIESNLVKENSDVVFNPQFGICSKQCGGADADIFIDGVLYDFKSSKKRGYNWKEIAQLMGYYLFNEIAIESDFGEVSLRGHKIEKIAIYKARYGEVEYFDISNIDTTRKNIAINRLIDNLNIDDVKKIEITKEDIEKMEYEEKNIGLSGVERLCTKCNEEKPIEYFERNGTDSKGNIKYRRQCKECRNKIKRK